MKFGSYSPKLLSTIFSASITAVCLSMASPFAMAHGGLKLPPLLPPTPSSPDEVYQENHSLTDSYECTEEEREIAFRQDQEMVLERIGALTTLNDLHDVQKLALAGWAGLPHAWVSMEGVGITFARQDRAATFFPSHNSNSVPDPVPGMPDLLFYTPVDESVDATDPAHPDFPYEFVGWAYLDDYNFNQHPTSAGPCFSRDQWTVHEQGVHPFDDWTFVPVPPRENFRGEVEAYKPFFTLEPGVPHIRAWDIHVWKDGTTEGYPSTEAQHPNRYIPGVDPHIGEWFYYVPTP